MALSIPFQGNLHSNFQTRVAVAACQRWRSTQVSYDQAILNVPETVTSQLGNGLRIASEDSGIPTATVSTHEEIYCQLTCKGLCEYLYDYNWI